MRPVPGDVVRLDGEWWGAKAGATAVIDSSPYPNGLMVVFGASAFRPLDGSHVSCSGGPCPSIPAESLTFVGTTERRFWHWRHSPMKNGGVEYLATVNLWSWKGPRSN